MRLQKKRHEMEAAAAKEKAHKEQVGHLNEDTFFKLLFFRTMHCVIAFLSRKCTEANGECSCMWLNQGLWSCSNFIYNYVEDMPLLMARCPRNGRRPL